MWGGVTCSRRHPLRVIALKLRSQNLAGYLSPHIGNLSFLRIIELANNSFQGQIPPEIGRLQRLSFLHMGNNSFNGEIPARYWLKKSSKKSPIISSMGEPFLEALIFEYMPNGSLDTWLHPNEEQHNSTHLNFMQRLNVAIDVASALDYLHHHCEAPIVHCDLKPSNVLLDEDMVAHVGDFGLARIFSKDVEYGMGGEVSTYGDMYSYGVLLLEMFMGKRPTDDIFKDNLNLHQLAKMAFPERVTEIIDHLLLLQGNENISSNEDYNEMKSRMHECLLSLVRIARYWLKKSSKKSPIISSMGEPFLEVTYAELLKATDGFSSTNLIGVGSFGFVYKGFLDQLGLTVAIKVLKLQQHKASKSFIAECKALRSIRHRNIVKILSVCSSIDFTGNDFKALIEYMPNGSLDTWLHPNEEQQNLTHLNLMQRLNVAIDMASAWIIFITILKLQ
ncbi:hypothetical protein AAC387_Pa04g0979 [Persea americana]